MPSKKLIYDHFKLIFGFQFQMEIQGIGRRRRRGLPKVFIISPYMVPVRQKYPDG